jgi:hypothetical protein
MPDRIRAWRPDGWPIDMANQQEWREQISMPVAADLRAANQAGRLTAP